MKHSKIEFCPNPAAITVNTTFNIQENIALKFIIEQIAGVEEIVSWGASKYSFLVIVGSMFDKNEVAKIIQQKIEDFASE